MEQSELVMRSGILTSKAAESVVEGKPGEANAHLLELRELLNDQGVFLPSGAPEETPAVPPGEH